MRLFLRAAVPTAMGSPRTATREQPLLPATRENVHSNDGSAVPPPTKIATKLTRGWGLLSSGTEEVASREEFRAKFPGVS